MDNKRNPDKDKGSKPKSPEVCGAMVMSPRPISSEISTNMSRSTMGGVVSSATSLFRMAFDGGKNALLCIKKPKRKVKLTKKAILEKKRKIRNMVAVPYPMMNLQPGRPNIYGPIEHAFNIDYDSSVYLNPETRSIEKITVPVPVQMFDENLEWHDFKYPTTLNRKEKEAMQEAEKTEREKRTHIWVQGSLSKAGRNNAETKTKEDNEMAIVRERIRDLLKIPQNEFLTLLYEIRYRRAQQQHKRGIRRLELLEEKKALMMKRKEKRWRSKVLRKRRETWNQLHTVTTWTKRTSVRLKWSLHLTTRFLKRWIVKPLKASGFHEPSSASVLHYCCCFHIGAMSLALLVQQKYESEDLNQIFGQGSQYNVLPTRIASMIGLSISSFACVMGVIGQFFKQGTLLWIYLVLVYLGFFTHFGNLIKDGLFLSESHLQTFIISEIYDFDNDETKSKKEKDDSLLKFIQSEFQCCGAKDFSDYGYVHSLVPPGVKYYLPLSCCDYQSYMFTSRGFNSCYVKFGGDPDEVPVFVNQKGCTTPVKEYLGLLHSNSRKLIPFYVFACFAAILTFLNLYQHFKHFGMSTIWHRKNVAADIINIRKMTTCEALLQDILESTTSTLHDEMEHVPGTIDSILARLATCETIEELVPTMVDIIHENEILHVTDPSISARVILGLRPRRFLSDALLDEEFQILLEAAPTSSVKRTLLAQRDLIYRIQMHKSALTAREQLDLEEEHADEYPMLVFPLPRPLSGVRIARWERIHDYLTRRDVYDIGTKQLDPLDPLYLDEDRVILPPDPEIKNIFKKLKHHFMPKDIYDYLECEQFRPQMERLSHIIGECQGILRDIRRRIIIKELNLNLALNKNSPYVQKRRGSIYVDPNKITETLRHLYELESLKEAKSDWRNIESRRKSLEKMKQKEDKDKKRSILKNSDETQDNDNIIDE